MNNLENIEQRINVADPDRFRAARLAGKKDRERLMWLYAFHLELAKVPEIVSETMIGDIRYQWWRDAVAEIYASDDKDDIKVRAHEVATPLASVLRDADIPRFWVDRLIDGRSRDLDPTPFSGIDAAKDYCRQTSGVLMQIAAKCLSHDFDTERVMGMGEAWGLTGLCRAYPYYHGTMLSELKFETLCSAALETYRSVSIGSLEAEIMPACAYTTLVPSFLKRMTQDGFEAKDHVAVVSPVTKQFRQFRAVLTGRI